LNEIILKNNLYQKKLKDGLIKISEEVKSD